MRIFYTLITPAWAAVEWPRGAAIGRLSVRYASWLKSAAYGRRSWLDACSGTSRLWGSTGPVTSKSASFARPMPIIACYATSMADSVIH